MLQTLLIEFEGVIADTATQRRAALGRALAERGVRLAEHGIAAASDGAAALVAARAALDHAGAPHDETDAELLALAAERYFSTALASGGVPLAEGAHAFVRAARERARLAVVTRARRRDVELALSLAGLDDAFAFVVAADETAEPKPAPDAYLRALRRLSPIARDRVVALEDGAGGVRAARAAGVRCILVGVSVPAAARAEADGWAPALASLSLDALSAFVVRQRGSAA
jgi:HAD superfamily hydrolase (TIGR01509 family)